MTLLRLRVTRLVTLNSKSWLNAPFSTNIGNEIEAKLHTAISSSEVNSMISVQSECHTYYFRSVERSRDENHQIYKTFKKLISNSPLQVEPDVLSELCTVAQLEVIDEAGVEGEFVI